MSAKLRPSSNQNVTNLRAFNDFIIVFLLFFVGGGCFSFVGCLGLFLLLEDEEMNTSQGGLVCRRIFQRGTSKYNSLLQVLGVFLMIVLLSSNNNDVHQCKQISVANAALQHALPSIFRPCQDSGATADKNGERRHFGFR